MEGDPDCSWASFQCPLLRRCLSSPITLVDGLGCGVDGIVWKVTVDEKPYALKVASHPRASQI